MSYCLMVILISCSNDRTWSTGMYFREVVRYLYVALTAFCIAGFLNRLWYIYLKMSIMRCQLQCSKFGVPGYREG